MSEVKRYDGKIKHVGDGGYVSYKDYAKLKAQRDALAAENAELNQLFSTKEFSTEVTDAFSDTAVLRIDGDEHHSWQWVDNDSAVIRAVLDAMKPETKATDDYLNSVRADAVQDAAKRLFGQGYTFEVITRFAAKLRSGKDGE